MWIDNVCSIDQINHEYRQYHINQPTYHIQSFAAP